MAKGQIRGAGGIGDLTGAAESKHVELLVQTMDQTGSHDAVRSRLSACFDPAHLPSITTDAIDGIMRFHVTADLRDQLEIDATVDRLRQAAFSICQLQIKRPTLEDTFIRLVGEPADQPSSNTDEGTPDSLTASDDASGESLTI